MRKILILALCLSLVLLLLVACDSGSEGDGRDDESTETTVLNGDGASGNTSASQGSTDTVGGTDVSQGTTDTSGNTDSSQGTTDTSVNTDGSHGTTDTVGGTDESQGTTDTSANTDSSQGTTDTSGGIGGGDNETPILPSTGIFDTIKNRLSPLVNYEVKTTYQTSGGGYTVIGHVDGPNEYMSLSMGGALEEMWYVDGVYYFRAQDSAFKAELSPEEYSAYGAGGLGSLGFVLTLDGDIVKSARRVTGDKYENYRVVVDGARYTEYLHSQGVTDVTYSDITYTFGFDENKILEVVKIECEYVQSGISISINGESQIYNVGKALVEAPDGDFVDMTETLTR